MIETTHVSTPWGYVFAPIRIFENTCLQTLGDRHYLFLGLRLYALEDTGDFTYIQTFKDRKEYEDFLSVRYKALAEEEHERILKLSKIAQQFYTEEDTDEEYDRDLSFGNLSLRKPNAQARVYMPGLMNEESAIVPTVNFEYDENWVGGELEGVEGNYENAGCIVQIPTALIDETDEKTAFETFTGFHRAHIVHWEAETSDACGDGKTQAELNALQATLRARRAAHLDTCPVCSTVS